MYGEDRRRRLGCKLQLLKCRRQVVKWVNRIPGTTLWPTCAHTFMHLLVGLYSWIVLCPQVNTDRIFLESSGTHHGQQYIDSWLTHTHTLSQLHIWTYLKPIYRAGPTPQANISERRSDLRLPPPPVISDNSQIMQIIISSLRVGVDIRKQCKVKVEKVITCMCSSQWCWLLELSVKFPYQIPGDQTRLKGEIERTSV